MSEYINMACKEVEINPPTLGGHKFVFCPLKSKDVTPMELYLNFLFLIDEFKIRGRVEFWNQGGD